MAGPDRAVSVLRLFTLDRPSWSVDEAAAALGVSTSSAYRYFGALTDVGLLVGGRDGTYVLGPAIIQYDRQMRLTDPLLRAARECMSHLLGHAPPGGVVLLCRLFGDSVLCVDRAATGGPERRVSYERGRPMPLFRGATSKAMLPFLPPRDQRRLFAAHAEAIAEAGLGADWDGFRRSLGLMRKAGHVVTRAEVDPGSIGIGVAILDETRRAIGSLSYVVPAAEERLVVRLAPLVVAGAREIEAALAVGMSADDGEGVRLAAVRSLDAEGSPAAIGEDDATRVD